MTNKLIKRVHEKTIAYREYCMNKDNPILKEKYKMLSALVKKEGRQEKVRYYSNLLDENKHDLQEYWNIVNNIRGRKENDIITEIKIDRNNTEIKVEGKELEVAQEFNKYFNKVPDNLLAEKGMEENKDLFNKNEEIPLPEIKADNGRKYQTKLASLELTADNVERAIIRLKNKKSSGRDGISSYMIKQYPNFFAKLLVPLYNKSLAQGIHPNILKEAIVVPVYKNGEKYLVKNYRPISIISTISKIFEACVKEKMGNYLEYIKFFCDNQYGFMKGKSTDTALFKHTSQITDSIENNKLTMGVYLI